MKKKFWKLLFLIIFSCFFSLLKTNAMEVFYDSIPSLWHWAKSNYGTSIYVSSPDYGNYNGQNVELYCVSPQKNSPSSVNVKNILTSDKCKKSDSFECSMIYVLSSNYNWQTKLLASRLVASKYNKLDGDGIWGNGNDGIYDCSRKRIEGKSNNCEPYWQNYGSYKDAVTLYKNAINKNNLDFSKKEKLYKLHMASYNNAFQQYYFITSENKTCENTDYPYKKINDKISIRNTKNTYTSSANECYTELKTCKDWTTYYIKTKNKSISDSLNNQGYKFKSSEEFTYKNETYKMKNSTLNINSCKKNIFDAPLMSCVTEKCFKKVEQKCPENTYKTFNGSIYKRNTKKTYTTSSKECYTELKTCENWLIYYYENQNQSVKDQYSYLDNRAGKFKVIDSKTIDKDNGFTYLINESKRKNVVTSANCKINGKNYWDSSNNKPNLYCLKHVCMLPTCASFENKSYTGYLYKGSNNTQLSKFSPTDDDIIKTCFKKPTCGEYKNLKFSGYVYSGPDSKTVDTTDIFNIDKVAQGKGSTPLTSSFKNFMNEYKDNNITIKNNKIINVTTNVVGAYNNYIIKNTCFKNKATCSDKINEFQLTNYVKTNNGWLKEKENPKNTSIDINASKDEVLKTCYSNPISTCKDWALFFANNKYKEQLNPYDNSFKEYKFDDYDAFTYKETKYNLKNENTKLSSTKCSNNGGWDNAYNGPKLECLKNVCFDIDTSKKSCPEDKYKTIKGVVYKRNTKKTYTVNINECYDKELSTCEDWASFYFNNKKSIKNYFPEWYTNDNHNDGNLESYGYHYSSPSSYKVFKYDGDGKIYVYNELKKNDKLEKSNSSVTSICNFDHMPNEPNDWQYIYWNNYDSSRPHNFIYDKENEDYIKKLKKDLPKMYCVRAYCYDPKDEIKSDCDNVDPNFKGSFTGKGTFDYNIYSSIKDDKTKDNYIKTCKCNCNSSPDAINAGCSLKSGAWNNETYNNLNDKAKESYNVACSPCDFSNSKNVSCNNKNINCSDSNKSLIQTDTSLLDSSYYYKKDGVTLEDEANSIIKLVNNFVINLDNNVSKENKDALEKQIDLLKNNLEKKDINLANKNLDDLISLYNKIQNINKANDSQNSSYKVDYDLTQINACLDSLKNNTSSISKYNFKNDNEENIYGINTNSICKEEFEITYNSMGISTGINTTLGVSSYLEMKNNLANDNRVKVNAIRTCYVDDIKKVDNNLIDNYFNHKELYPNAPSFDFTYDENIPNSGLSYNESKYYKPKIDLENNTVTSIVTYSYYPHTSYAIDVVNSNLYFDVLNESEEKIDNFSKSGIIKPYNSKNNNINTIKKLGSNYLNGKVFPIKFSTKINDTNEENFNDSFVKDNSKNYSFKVKNYNINEYALNYQEDNNDCISEYACKYITSKKDCKKTTSICKYVCSKNNIPDSEKETSPYCSEVCTCLEDTSTKKSKSTDINFIYNQISNDNLFDGYKVLGSNWLNQKGTETIEKIKETSKTGDTFSKKNLVYEVKLSYSDIKSIQKKVKDEGYIGNVNCLETIGNSNIYKCQSEFLKELDAQNNIKYELYEDKKTNSYLAWK